MREWTEGWKGSRGRWKLGRVWREERWREGKRGGKGGAERREWGEELKRGSGEGCGGG